MKARVGSRSVESTETLRRRPGELDEVVTLVLKPRKIGEAVCCRDIWICFS